VSRATDLLARMPGWAPIVLAGVLLAGLVYGYVGGSRPVYEAEAVVSAESPALLAEWDRVIRPEVPTVPAEDRRLGPGDLGNLAGAISSARGSLEPRWRDSRVEIAIDAEEGEASIIARAADARASRTLANTVAASIVTDRTLTTFLRLESATQELLLIAGLARTAPALRPRVAALRREIKALNQLVRTPSGGLGVLRRAQTPREPVGPRVGRDVILAGVFGMLAAVSARGLWRTAPPRLRRLRRPRRLRPADA
jgi:hypothetical protein